MIQTEYDAELEEMLEDADFEETHRCARCDALPIAVDSMDEEFFLTTCTEGHETVWERSNDQTDT